MDAYIFDAVRTPRGKGKKDGALHGVTPLELSATPLRALRARSTPLLAQPRPAASHSTRCKHTHTHLHKCCTHAFTLPPPAVRRLRPAPRPQQNRSGAQGLLESL